MRRRILSLLLAVFLVAAVFTGCSAGKSVDQAGNSGRAETTAAKAPMAEAKAADGYKGDFGGTGMETDDVKKDTAAAEATGITGGGNVGETVSNAVLAQRKIIRNANVTVEVENFDEAYGRINSFILGIGFVSESNVSTDRVRADGEVKLVKRGVIVIRVDRDKFDKVLSSVKGLGTVLNESSGTEDVTAKYYDIESRLRLLRYEESRLEEYLRKVSDPDTIFKTESRLTDIRHEIEGLTVNLQRLSDLVELSTITINMNEKYPGSDEPPKPVGYGDRLLNNFLDSIKGVVRFCGELIILIVQALPVLILMGLFVLVVLFIYRKIAHGGRRGNTPKNPGDGGQIQG